MKPFEKLTIILEAVVKFGTFSSDSVRMRKFPKEVIKQ